MSQFGRSFATAASSFASKRSYTQTIRIPAAPGVAGTYSNPGSPTGALFSLYGGHARTPGSQSQVPFASNPPLPAGISPASQPQIAFWTTSPPCSPSQLQFRIGQQHMQPQMQMPPSPGQMQFNMANMAMFAPQQTKSIFDLGFALAEAESTSPAFSASPASTCRSMSPTVITNTGISSAIQPPSPPMASIAPRKSKRDDGKEVKKGLNPFTYYRKTFPARYPHIDAIIPTQMERSRLTGAFWQNESPAVRAQCAQAVYINRTPAQIERLENIRLQTQEKRRQERVKAGTDKLNGRNALIFGLWSNGVSPREFTAAVEAHDHEYPLPEPARKRRRKTAAPKLDASLLLATESLSVASSSPQPSPSSLSHSPASVFNPELPRAVLETQSSWRPLASMMAQTSYQYMPTDMSNVEAMNVGYTGESSAMGSSHLRGEEIQTQYHPTTLYDGMLAGFSNPPYVLGSEANLDAILDAYSYPMPQHPHQDRLPTEMDYDFRFTETLPTEEDGLAFDVAYFGSVPGPALDA